MDKQIINTKKATLHKQINELTTRTAYLSDMLIRLPEESLISPTIERELIDNGYLDLFNDLKTAQHDAVVKILQDKIKAEEKVLMNLMKLLRQNDEVKRISARA